MAKISQSVPSQANNQLNTHLPAGPTGLHSTAVIVQPKAILWKMQLCENDFSLMTPAIDRVLTQQNLWPVGLAAEGEKKSHGPQRHAIKTRVSLFSEK